MTKILLLSCALLGAMFVYGTASTLADHDITDEPRRIDGLHPAGSGPMDYSVCTSDSAIADVWSWGPESWEDELRGTIDVRRTSAECSGAFSTKVVMLWEYLSIDCGPGDTWACFLFFKDGNVNFEHASGDHWHVNRAYIAWDQGNYSDFPSVDYKRYASAHEFGHGMNLGHHSDSKCDDDVDWVMAEYLPPSGSICRWEPNGGEVCSAMYEYAFVSYDCEADTDGDGCTQFEEDGPSQVFGGLRNWADSWDFFDVPVPALTSANPNGFRNKIVLLSDALAITWYGGTRDNAGPNLNGVDYDTDLNGNGVEDGREYDRTPSLNPSQPWRSGPPNTAVTGQDALVATNQIGHQCVNEPN